MIYFTVLFVVTFFMYFGYGVITDLTENDIASKEDVIETKQAGTLHKLVKYKSCYLCATYIVTTLLHVFLSIVLFVEFHKIFKDMFFSGILTVAVFVAVVVLCIFIPEKIGRSYAKRFTKKDKEEEILSMVNEGHEMGVLEAGEVLMISNIFEMGDKMAKDIMVNRSNMIALDSAIMLEEAIDFMLGNQYSRYPVYEESVDSIIGMLYLKDALRLHAKDNLMNKSIKNIRSLLRKPVYIPETKKIDDIFKILKSKKVQLAIVINEYGQTAGLISMEDILEEIVGNIMDEYDVDEHHIKHRGENKYAIDGLTKLEELEEILNIEFHSEFETVNGFMISKLEHIPKEREKFSCVYEGYQFSILKVRGKMIHSVLVEKLPDIEISEEKTTIEEEEK